MAGKKAFFLIGLILGLAALILLFAFPAGGFWWFLFVFSGALTAPPRKSENGSTKDVSNIALTVAFFAVAVLFALLLIPDAVWTSVHWRVPDWAYGRTHESEAVPMWGRVGLAVFWSLVTWRRFQQLEVQHAETAV